MNICGMQRAPLPVRKPKHTGVALRHAATRNVIIAETVVCNNAVLRGVQPGFGC
jgi:hypothetical protein